MENEIQVFNTLGRELQDFEPRDSTTVNMYVCGVTVYDDCHIGHGRVYVVFDVIRRFLEYEGYTVNYVENFTDVEDKVFNRATEEDKTWDQVAQENIDSYIDVMDDLNIIHADEARNDVNSPRVSGHIQEIIDHVDALVDKGVAYERGGNVFYEVNTFSGYGKLSGQDTDEMMSGSRIEVDERKKSPLDFVLWKDVSPEGEENGIPAWDSPWGRGRPGWHIECSVMASESFDAETLDIHGGGRDLIFPHHENEIAQSEARTGEPFSKYWIHNGFVTIDEEKMSKSEDNFYTLKELMDEYEFQPMDLRYFILTRHYRNPIDFSFSRLEEAQSARETMESFKSRLKTLLDESAVNSEGNELAPELRTQFLNSLRTDFNTAKAIGILHKWISKWNETLSEWELDTLNSDREASIQSALDWFDTVVNDILGLQVHGTKTGEGMSQEIQGMLRERDEARANGNYEKADEIRDRIRELGYEIEDTPQGQRVIELES